MKLKFKNQEFQTIAVNAVCDIFKGQKKRTETFTITNEIQLDMLGGIGFKNVLDISNEQINSNMHEVQRRQNLPLTDLIKNNEINVPHFSVEMETGTGKTYVYTKTIFELHKQYGFKKFIIVVTSVAIREGVYKSFEITAEHFGNQYDNVPVRCFIYDSKKLSQVKMFATSGNIEIMIINIDAFKKAENIINQEQDRLFGETAMKYIQDTNPIIIIDEPQSVDNTPKAKEAIMSLNPLSVFRYSATHREKINLLYRLTPVDAYQMGLVKQICVSSNEVESDFNRPYIRCISVNNEGGFTAKIEIDENILKKAQIRRTIETHLEKELRYTEKGIKVLSLFFIDEVSKYRTIGGVKGIYAEMFEESYKELMSMPKYKKLKDKFTGNINSIHDGYFSQDKKGNYKNTKGNTIDDYDTYNTIMKDKEWLLSFECPLRFIFSHSALKEGWDNPNVFQICTLIEQKSTFTARQKVGRGLRLPVNQEGERIEDKNINILHVMANESFKGFADTLQKEIEQETGVKFGVLEISLFSGLTFNKSIQEEKKVSADEAKIISEYVETFVINTTNKENLEPVEKFQAQNSSRFHTDLNPVIEKVLTRVKNGEKVTPEKIEKMTYIKTSQVKQKITYDEANELLSHFEKKGYMSKSGVIKDTMKVALQNGTLDIPSKFEAARDKFENVIAKANIKPPIQNVSKEVRVRLKKQVMNSPEFENLWEQIKGRTSYNVQIEEKRLKTQGVLSVSGMGNVTNPTIVTKTATLNVENSGVTVKGEYERAKKLENIANRLPNFIRTIDEKCFITRNTIIEILFKSGKISNFINNPQKFIEEFIEILRNIQGEMEIDGISYKRLRGEDYFLQEIFDSEELIAYLDKNAINVENSLYDHVIYDSSTVERPFAVALDNDPDVKMFFKIPKKFKIATPIGNYNPDWAVYIEKEDIKKMYFVLETKGTTNMLNLRSTEKMKIQCGKQHFKALSNKTDFEVVSNWKEFKVKI